MEKGLYEKIINKALKQELAKIPENFYESLPIDNEESPKLLAKYVADLVEKRLENIKDYSRSGDLSGQVKLVNKIIQIMQEDNYQDVIDDDNYNVKQLLSVVDTKDSVHALIPGTKTTRPVTSIAQSSLFTGADKEPQMDSELNKEILSCDRIDFLVSFIKWSGLRLLIKNLKEFTDNGGKLRIITTSYMGATDIKAIDELAKLSNTEIKISYDTKRTRLHAKAYIFHRNTGFTTAYVGSSNLSNVAISSGLEWNIKVTKSDLPQTIDKIIASFDSYWASKDFVNYSALERSRLEKAIQSERKHESTSSLTKFFTITPFSYQEEILNKLQAEREIHGQYRNIVVAATGTGKTIISAFDYLRFRRKHKDSPCRLLFIAHREEILDQSRSAFRAILKDNDFGQLFVGRHRPIGHINHLFMSIQSFNSRDFTEKTNPYFYDFIIVDEFHHAAAPSYQKLLTYYKPKILLGLTATPERMDGKSVLEYFNNRIAAEIRLPEAIDRKLLSPFQYFGVEDSVNLADIKWTRGGYDSTELSNIYTLSGAIAQRRSRHIAESLYRYIADIDEIKGLGFCVSKAHANFMADSFNSFNIPSISLTSDSDNEKRGTAEKRLLNGEFKFIFVVDIYNEGVDIPELNTVLFLRPTESLTIFLQQLGRGLRISEGKECLTVLDFIGQANNKYSFEDKFKALLSTTERSLKREIEDGFTSLPKGCHIVLEKKASEHILENIKASIRRSNIMLSRIATFKEDTGLKLNLTNFLNYYHLHLNDLYPARSFSRLCVDAGMKENFKEDMEDVLQKAFYRFSILNSRRLIKFFIKILDNHITNFDDEELLMLQVFQFTIWQKSFEECGFYSLVDGIVEVKNSPSMCKELIELLEYRYEQIDFVDEKVDLGFPCPLDLHCTYTRDQILVALDFLKPNTVREGVKYLPEKNLDIFFVTLNKSDKDYSPTTMYKDYSIDELHFHWQSQSTTSDSSPTGQRYINHRRQKSQILLFVREHKSNPNNRQQVSPYTFLGKANYLYHEGSRPMSITWKLEKPIPASFIKKTNKLLAL